MTLGTALRTARTSQRIPQEELARRCGVTAQYLSLIENDKREPSLSLLRAIGEALGLSLGSLLWAVLDDRSKVEMIATFARSQPAFILELLRQARWQMKEQEGGTT